MFVETEARLILAQQPFEIAVQFESDVQLADIVVLAAESYAWADACKAKRLRSATITNKFLIFIISSL